VTERAENAWGVTEYVPRSRNPAVRGLEPGDAGVVTRLPAGQPGHPQNVLDDHRQSMRLAQRIAAGCTLVGVFGQPQALLGVGGFRPAR